MIRLLTFIFCLMALASVVQASPPLSVTLPDDGQYSYWLQSRSGAVHALPVNITHQTTFLVRVPLNPGDQLMLLDATTGQWAQQTVAIGDDGKPTPLVFALGDFHAPSSQIPVATPTAAAPPPPAEDTDNGSGRLWTGLISLVLAGGVGWLIWSLIKSRGEPLRVLAQRLGIETPEPTLPASDDPDMIFKPSRRAPDAVPAAASRFVAENDFDLHRGPEMPMAEPASLIGVQGLAAGSTFTLTAGDVTIGRDGENEIVLAENTVSRYHARLLRQDNGQFALTDLGSANGVYVNGTRVQRAILHSGDQIKVGDNYFRFQTNGETR